MDRVILIWVITPESELPKNHELDKNDLNVRSGYPFQYYKDEILTNSDVRYRLKLNMAKTILLVQVNTSVPVINQIGLPPIIQSVNRFNESTLHQHNQSNRCLVINL